MPPTPSTTSSRDAAARGMASAPTVVIEGPEGRQHGQQHHHHGHHPHRDTSASGSSHHGLHHGLVLPPIEGAHPGTGSLRRPSREEAERVQRQLLGSSGPAGAPALPASASASGAAEPSAVEPTTLVPVKEHALQHPEHTVTVTAPASVPTPEGPPEASVVAPEEAGGDTPLLQGPGAV
jgi:hypothetical protein